MPTIETLNPHIGAEVRGVDLRARLDEADFSTIKRALDQHSVLVFRNQNLTDAQQSAFSARFGRLLPTRLGAIGEGGALVVLTNLGEDGKPVPASHKQTFDSRGNQMWHSDASFRPVPAYASILSGRQVAKTGGETEFASTRVAFSTLDPAKQSQLRSLRAIHHFAHSRSLVEPDRLAKAEADHLPPVRHPLVRRHSFTGEGALFIGSHLREIEGMNQSDSQALHDELLAHTTRENFVHVHHWQPFDVIIWDNSAVLHRGRPWDPAEPRHLVRATVADDGFVAGELVAA